MARDIKKVLEKVIKYGNDTKEGKKSNTLNVAKSTLKIETIYLPKKTW